jgi:hypothetical protein
MSLLITVLIVFVVLVIIYYIIDWATAKSTKLSHISHARKKRISGKKLKGSNSSNFTFSVWFNVDDWSVNYGKVKKLLQVQCQNIIPLEIQLGAESNDIKIKTKSFGSAAAPPPGSGGLAASTQSHTCHVQNFPLQKWVNLIVSAYGRTLDVYIDGKLVKTCVLPGAVAMHNISQIILTEGTDGKPCFKGMTADLTYWSTASNPQQAYNIYAAGFGGMGSNFFSKYKLKVSFLEDGKTEGSFEI